MKQPKEEPLRMCAVCKAMQPKSALIRIVKTKDGTVCIDNTGKTAGRGAYICNTSACIEQCIKKRVLNRSFKQQINLEVYDAIAKFITKT